MSILVRQKGRSEVVLYSKGADSVIYRNLRSSLESSVFQESGFDDPDTVSLPSQGGGDISHSAPKSPTGGSNGVSKVRRSAMGVVLVRDRTQSHLDDYARIGLRTLCIAKRVSIFGRGCFLALFVTQDSLSAMRRPNP